MKHKNILLIVFLLTLFVFQQVQAGATMPSAEKPSQINAAPSNVDVLYKTVSVYMYKLVDTTGEIASPMAKCKWDGNFEYGCGNASPPQIDETNSFYIVNVEDDPSRGTYLRDVVATEMNLAELYPPAPEALMAQVVAARTFASWKSANGPWDKGNGIYGSGDPIPENGWPKINNSRTYQVYIPGAHITSGYSTEITKAVNDTKGQFLQYILPNSNGHAIDASFAADMQGAVTQGGGDLINAPYKVGVQDPISIGCVKNLGNAQYGMSQRGAIRWAKGNTCPEGTGAAWPVKWEYKQILAHYYTGVDFVNDNTGENVAPADRWNLLKYELPNGATATAGTNFDVNMMLQNTSILDWGGSDIEIGYHWGDQVWHVAGTLPSGSYPKGKETVMFPIQVTEFPSTGTYTLHLDLRHRVSGQDSAVGWFSKQSPAWPDATIDVQVNGTTATPTVTPTVCTSWNLADDFRIAPYEENPNHDSCNNPGVWLFMGSTSLDRTPPYYLLDGFIPNVSTSRKCKTRLMLNDLSRTP
jgi:hypothetical protein